MFSVPQQNAQIVAYLKELMETGKFTAVIDWRYSLDKIVEAHQYVESGRKVDNVVITVVEPT